MYEMFSPCSLTCSLTVKEHTETVKEHTETVKEHPKVWDHNFKKSEFWNFVESS